MTNEQLNKFKKLFEDQKKGLLYSQRWIQEEFAVKSEDMADEADLSSAELEQSMRLRLRSREAMFIQKIDVALTKIQAGTFGVCEDCGEDIETSRLEVRPTAHLCIHCKETEECKETRFGSGLRIA